MSDNGRTQRRAESNLRKSGSKQAPWTPVHQNEQHNHFNVFLNLLYIYWLVNVRSDIVHPQVIDGHVILEDGQRCHLAVGRRQIFKLRQSSTIWPRFVSFVRFLVMLKLFCSPEPLTAAGRASVGSSPPIAMCQLGQDYTTTASTGTPHSVARDILHVISSQNDSTSRLSSVTCSFL